MNLSAKVYSLEGRSICLQNIKLELLEQLLEARTAHSMLEKKVSHLHSELSKTRQEKENMEITMIKMEVSPHNYNHVILFSFSCRPSCTGKPRLPTNLLLPHHLHRLQSLFYPVWSCLSKRRTSAQSQCPITWMLLQNKVGNVQRGSLK